MYGTKLKDHLCLWKRYPGDTLTFVGESCIECLLLELNFFHPNIQLMYQLEKKNKVLRCSNYSQHGTFETTVFRKSTNTDIYLNWQSLAPNTW